MKILTSLMSLDLSKATNEHLPPASYPSRDLHCNQRAATSLEMWGGYLLLTPGCQRWLLLTITIAVNRLRGFNWIILPGTAMQLMHILLKQLHQHLMHTNKPTARWLSIFLSQTILGRWPIWNQDDNAETHSFICAPCRVPQLHMNMHCITPKLTA